MCVFSCIERIRISFLCIRSIFSFVYYIYIYIFLILTAFSDAFVAQHVCIFEWGWSSFILATNVYLWWGRRVGLTVCCLYNVAIIILATTPAIVLAAQAGLVAYLFQQWCFSTVSAYLLFLWCFIYRVTPWFLLLGLFSSITRI